MAERAAEAKILRLGLLIEVLECMGLKLDMHRGMQVRLFQYAIAHTLLFPVGLSFNSS